MVLLLVTNIAQNQFI